MDIRRSTVPLAVAAVLLACPPASAAVKLGLGADYWAPGGGVFELTLGIDTPLARHVHIGGRFGALVATSPNTFGVPLDLELRILFGRGRVYAEGLLGPWIFFSGDPVRAHVAFGFGLQSGSLSFGLEVGYLTPSPIAGLKLAFRI